MRTCAKFSFGISGHLLTFFGTKFCQRTSIGLYLHSLFNVLTAALGSFTCHVPSCAPPHSDYGSTKSQSRGKFLGLSCFLQCHPVLWFPFSEFSAPLMSVVILCVLAAHICLIRFKGTVLFSTSSLFVKKKKSMHWWLQKLQTADGSNWRAILKLLI